MHDVNVPCECVNRAEPLVRNRTKFNCILGCCIVRAFRGFDGHSSVSCLSYGKNGSILNGKSLLIPWDIPDMFGIFLA